MNTMRVLTVGDVVGPDAARRLADRLPALRAEHAIDWVIVNVENAAVTGPRPIDGFGTTHETLESLSSAGVDVFTGGNHSWDGPEVEESFAHPRMVRPSNVSETRGRGVLTIGEGPRVLTIVNLLSPTAVGEGCLAPRPRPVWRSWLELVEAHELHGAVLVDLHSASPGEKAWFAGAVDGRAAVVVGTHTHDGTALAHLLPGGTGFVAELGMVGRLGFSGYGFDPAYFVRQYRGEDVSDLPPYQLATGPFTMGAALFDIENGLTITAARLAPNVLVD